MTTSTLTPLEPIPSSILLAPSPTKEETTPRLPRPVAVFFGTLAAIVLLNIVIYLPVSNSPFAIDDTLQLRNSGNLQSQQFATPHWLPIATLAMDQSLYGVNVRGFRFTSVCIHLVASCLVFWTVCVTLGMRGLPTRLVDAKLEIAAFSAICWSVHPLQTQAVMYTVQRTETLMAMFFLAAMLLFALALKTRKKTVFLISSAACYFAAVGCKEAAIAIPPVLLAFDLVFSERESSLTVKNRLLNIAKSGAWFYVLLLLLSYPFAKPLLQAATVLSGNDASPQAAATPNPSGVSDATGLTSLTYLATQTKVIAKYVQLASLPLGQNVDHGLEVSSIPFDRYFFPCFIGSLCLFGVYAAMKRWPIGFCLAAFFFTLAPTSSIIPLPELMVEHRMYLPLAFFIAPLASLAFTTITHRKTAVSIGVLLCVLLTGFSVARAQAYRNGISLWSDSTAKNPDNPRAMMRLAQSFEEAGKYPRAIETFEKALALMADRERVPSLITVEAIRIELSETQNNYAIILTRNKNYTAAREQLEMALENNPQNAAAHNSLGNVFVRLGDKASAKLSYEAALMIDPRMEMALKNLAIINATSKN